MFVIKYKNLFFLFSGLLIAGSLVAIFTYGLNVGTDFTGGSILEISYNQTRPDVELLRTTVAKLDFGTVALQPAGDTGLIARLRTINQGEKDSLEKVLSIGGQNTFTEKRFSAIGPTVGQELKRRGLIAVALVVLLIILFIAFVFRKVSRPVSSWKYGVTAFVALLHDLIIPTGVFAILGHYYGTQVDALFLTGLLTILGLSVHDTIVVFDRIRENLKHHAASTFAETVGQSLSETFTRSINTSLTIILVLVILFFYGAQSTKEFSLLMAIGVFVGTYSSIFIASPLLVVWNNWKQKN